MFSTIDPVLLLARKYWTHQSGDVWVDVVEHVQVAVWVLLAVSVVTVVLLLLLQLLVLLSAVAARSLDQVRTAAAGVFTVATASLSPAAGR